MISSRRLKHALCIALALVVSAGRLAAAETGDSSSGYLPLSSSKAAGITDLVLIYQGGTHRPNWTADEFAPYIRFRESERVKADWLFDGFLFIEFQDGRGHEFARGYKKQPARKEDWLWLLDRNFEPGHAVDALNQAIAAAAKTNGSPTRRRLVVLTLPEPIHGQTNWGKLDGRALDFSKSEDRVAACAWHVQTALTKWQALAPTHLDLAGFYWVAENAHQADDILPRIAADIHARGKRFFWIPYWNSAGAADWRKLGFDAAYQQPNHFFNPKVPDSRLEATCVLSRANGMGLEFECDHRAMTSAEVFRPRLHSYLETFERNGVKTNAAMAYYEGGGALLQMARAKDEEVVALYHEVARWVAARQRQADAAQVPAK